MESGLIPPIHLLKRCDLHLNHVGLFPAMNELILVRTVDVLGQGIVIRVTDGADRSGNTMFGQTFVVDDAYVLRPMIRMVCR